jgi:hypothetical protein
LLSKMWCETTLFQLGPFGLLWCNFIMLAMRLLNQWYWVFLALKEKVQYETNAFINTCNYLVLQRNFCPLQLVWHYANINRVTYD